MGLLTFYKGNGCAHPPTHTHMHTHMHARMHTHTHAKLKEGWSLIRIFFHQSGLSSGCSHQGGLWGWSHQYDHQSGLSSGLTFMRVSFIWGFSSGWYLGWSQSMITTAVSHQGGLWLGMVSHQSDLRVVFHLGVFIRMVFHQLTVMPWYHHMNLEDAVANNCSLGGKVYIYTC